jgi:hypothetical protein
MVRQILIITLQNKEFGKWDKIGWVLWIIQTIWDNEKNIGIIQKKIDNQTIWDNSNNKGSLKTIWDN